MNIGAEPVPAGLLVVDDDSDIREQMKWAFSADYRIIEAHDRPTAVDAAKREQPGLVTLDMGLPPDLGGYSEGLAALEAILQVSPITKVIVVTGKSEKEAVLKAVELGAYDYFQKPVQLDLLKLVLSRAAHLSSIEKELHRYREASRTGFGELIGSSPRMQKVFDMIRRVGDSDAPLLITGPSGTGKELVARATHHQSSQKEGPFVAINCGAIPENLLESELFGHEKGAFTGAHVQRKGRIELAHGGTLFLDEIGDMPLPLQVKLLRFLQERSIERIGGRETIAVDTRIIAATNRDLEQAIAAGRFREDLYYRLSVVSIKMPPLCERGGDVILLARAFLQQYSEQARKKITGFTPEAIYSMETYSWPGNVRELENRVKRGVIMADSGKLAPADLSLEAAVPKEEVITLKEARSRMEKELISRVVRRYGGNITKAAAELGISRPTLHDLLGKYSEEI